VSGAIDRFLEAARVQGIQPDVHRFPEGTKTAADAARAIGCEVGQIVKSLVFIADDRPVMAFTSGANRVDEAKLAAVVGAETTRRASPEEARTATGFAVGGTPRSASGSPSVWSSRSRLGSDLGAPAPDSVPARRPICPRRGASPAVFTAS
jgi:hypothetical protein